MIPVNKPLLDGNEKKYLIECIDSGWISSEGPFVSKLEENIAKRVGRKYGIAVSNGSVAIDAAITALGISKGDEVIIPTFTIISCVSQILRIGAIPIFVDVDLKNWNMDVSSIESKITQKTKAIMVVHIYGLPVNLDPILELSNKYGLFVIEDAAEVIGQTYNGLNCGSFGHLSTFSFYPNKHITTGEGGMILTDDENLANKCRELRNLSFIPPRRFIHNELGWNFRMTNLQAAVGVAQFERLDEFIAKKREIGSWYNYLLKDIKNIQLPLVSEKFAENIYWVYGILINKDFYLNAYEVMMKLNDLGIGTRPFFYPLHNQPLIKNLGISINGSYPNAEYLAEYGFYLPSGLSLTHNQAETVAKMLKKIF
uniref:DegT/DnrJ/EryC1/StrS family aminotransferase n=1 Tax=Algoriphagus sp. TaxID=1872435 RepID=UPI0040471000